MEKRKAKMMIINLLNNLSSLDFSLKNAFSYEISPTFFGKGGSYQNYKNKNEKELNPLSNKAYYKAIVIKIA